VPTFEPEAFNQAFPRQGLLGRGYQLRKAQVFIIYKDAARNASLSTCGFTADSGQGKLQQPCIS